MAFVNHPQRNELVTELHLRRMPKLRAPMRMVMTLRVVDADEREAERAHLADIPASGAELRWGERHADIALPDGRELLWERQSEASTTTLLTPRVDTATLRRLSVDDPVETWLVHAPGRVLRAVQVIVVETDTAAEGWVQQAGYDDEHLVSCHLDGSVRLWTDFRIHDGGMGFHVIAANGTSAGDLGRTVQRFQELCNYRNLALLGLKIAQTKAVELAALESRLVGLTQAIKSSADDAATLEGLVDIAAQTAVLTAESGYRMSATRAYGEIVADRLAALHPKQIDGYLNLSDFTERRLLPALRTCQSFSDRSERLAERIERATAQLQTRIEMAMQRQNTALLESLEQTSARQLRLQNLVEGLSVIAISYYALSLLSYLLKGSEFAIRGVRGEGLISAATIPVLLIVWMVLRWRSREAS